VIRARAKALYEALAADIKARCTTAFGIKDPVDVKIQQGLKEGLACVVRSELEGVESLFQLILAAFRDLGLTLPVRLLDHYLGASGSSIEVSRDEALQFGLIRNAVEVNIERFKERNFISPNPNNPAFSAVEDITRNPAARAAGFQDHWKRDIDRNSVSGVIKIGVRGISDPEGTITVLLGPGSSSLTSSGDFLMRRQGDRVLVTGTITHLWTDPGFDFNPGRILHEEAQILQRHGKARPFTWTAEWRAANREHLRFRGSAPLDQLRDAAQRLIEEGFRLAIKEGRQKTEVRIERSEGGPEGAKEQQPVKKNPFFWFRCLTAKDRPDHEPQQQGRAAYPGA
jgi:hypothetical protein